jgi:peptide/nickel transport system permease protein
MLRRAFREIVKICAVLLIAGFLGAALVRLAPGFGVSEQELDLRLREESISALREKAVGANVFVYYRDYLAGAARGDLGTSVSLGRPVRELMTERIPLTVRSVAIGLALGWVLALTFALSAACVRFWPYEALTTVIAGSLLCVPTAAIALLLVFARGPAPFVIALVVFPKVFRFTQNLLNKADGEPFVLAAMARGIGRGRILVRHILPATGRELIALAGISVSLALSASIPTEAICDSPGIGQLAWQAALARDLPLLVNVTLVVTFVTLVANSFSDVITVASDRDR